MSVFSNFAFGSLLILLAGCGSSTPKDAEDVSPPHIPTFHTFAELQVELDDSKRELQVLNFWMTSCPPCIKEMPHFNQLRKEFAAQGVEILLVSLDRASDIEERVIPFIEKHKILPQVVLLEDQDYSAWTGIIDSGWYGALPATLIMSGDQRLFKFGAYASYEDLKRDVLKVLGECK